MGGIAIDADARVMSTSGVAITGLYATGTTTGGLEGGENYGYVGGLSKATIFGLRAADHVLAHILQR
jgi:fumarate reductase flavoprotein subunit